MIIDDTGEILYESKEDENIYLFTPKGYVLDNNVKTVRIRTGRLPLAEMNGEDRSKLLILMQQIAADNRLVRLDRPNKGMEPKHIAELLGLSLSRTYVYLRKMVALGILKQHDDEYYANPLYLMASTRLSPDLYRIFETELKPVLPDWVIAKYKEA